MSFTGKSQPYTTSHTWNITWAHRRTTKKFKGDSSREQEPLNELHNKSKQFLQRQIAFFWGLDELHNNRLKKRPQVRRPKHLVCRNFGNCLQYKGWMQSYPGRVTKSHPCLSKVIIIVCLSNHSSTHGVQPEAILSDSDEKYIFTIQDATKYP